MTLSTPDGFTGAKGGFLEGMSAIMSGQEPVVPLPASQSNQPVPVETPAAPPASTDSAAPETPKLEPVKPLKKGIDALLDVESDDPDSAATATTSSTEDPADDLPPDAKTPEAKNAWSTIKKEVKEAKAEAARLQKELEEAKKLREADPLKGEAEAIRKRAEELEAKLATYDIRETREYQERIGEPKAELIRELKQLIGDFEIPMSPIEDAIFAPTLKEFLVKMDSVCESLSPAHSATITTMAQRLRNLEIDTQVMESKASEAMKEIRAKESQVSEQQKVARRAEEMRAVQDLAAPVKKLAAMLAQEGEDADSVATELINDANSVPFDEHDTKTRAFQTLTAAMYPRMQRQLATLTKQLKAKESEIARLTGASPRTSAGSPLPVTSASEPRPTSFAEALFGKKPEEM